MAISTPPLRVSLSRSSATTSRAQPARARRACQVAAQRSSQPVRLATRPCQTRHGDSAAARSGVWRCSDTAPAGRRTPSASDRGRRSPDTKPRSGPAGSPRCRYRRTTTRPVPSALGHALSPGPQRGGARTQRRPGGGLPRPPAEGGSRDTAGVGAGAEEAGAGAVQMPKSMLVLVLVLVIMPVFVFVFVSVLVSVSVSVSVFGTGASWRRGFERWILAAPA